MKNLKLVPVLLLIITMLLSCQSSDDYIVNDDYGVELKKAKPVKGKHPVFVVKEQQDNSVFLTKDLVRDHVNKRPDKLGVFINDNQGYLEYYTYSEQRFHIIATEENVRDTEAYLMEVINALEQRIKALENR